MSAENDAHAEFELLDLIYEALPDDVSASIYPPRKELPRPEFYVRFRGECWRILAKPHPHCITPPDAVEPGDNA